MSEPLLKPKDTATMTGNYDQTIAQTARLLTAAILAHKPDLRYKSLDVDREVLALVERLGQAVLQNLLAVGATR